MKKKQKSRISSESKNQYVGFRVGSVEYNMLTRLREFWKCSSSEAVRRCIVYTYVKFLMGADISMETLEKVYMELMKIRQDVGYG